MLFDFEARGARDVFESRDAPSIEITLKDHLYTAVRGRWSSLRARFSGGTEER